jgi:cytochrome c oxidase cbb3-type subunit 3
MTEKRDIGSSEEPLIPDHEYDGIQEYDNPMPGWWVWIFRGTFYFGVCYFLWFHVYMKGTPISEEYAQDMRAYREQEAKRAMGSKVTEEGLDKLMSNATVVSDAAGIFKARCVLCHNHDGQGLIGPNLTDNYWIHGQGKLMDIYGVVNDGVAAKGMPAWGRQLSPIEVAKVVAYVGSIRGRGLPGKPPEGVLVSTAPNAGSGG